jgi:hypothetical protein
MLHETGRRVFQVLRGAVITAVLATGCYVTVRCARAGFVGDLFASRCGGLAASLTKHAAKTTVDATSQFIIEQARCPTNVDELIEQHFLAQENRRDRWNRAFLYECWRKGDSYAVSVRSAGADHELGTPDDISAEDVLSSPGLPPGATP